MTSHACRSCGATYEHGRRMQFVEERLIELKLCFTCDHWEMNAAQDVRAENGYVGFVTVDPDGTTWHYGFTPTDQNDPRPQTLKGHAGRRFKVTLEDGTVHEGDNLWCQGFVPEHLLDVLARTPEGVLTWPTPAWMNA